MASPPEILFVDDSRSVRKLASKIFDSKYEIVTCDNAEEAWDKLRIIPSIKIVFTDIQMKGMTGFDLLKNIRESNNTRLATMPVIMITGAEDTDEGMRQVFEAGATDFIAKPFKQMDLLSRAYSYIKLSEQVSKLEDQLGIDKLSGLYNATSMKQHAVKFLAFAQRHNTGFSIAYLEMIEFDDIVKQHGNRIAAQILLAIANRLKKKIRSEDVVARIGTSRFAVLQPACSSVKSQVSISRVVEDIEKISFKLGEQELKISMATGICTADVTIKQTVRELLSQASQSVAAARSGNNRCVVFNEVSHERSQRIDILNLGLASSFSYIIEGDYDKVPASHVASLKEKMSAFFDYVNRDMNKGLMSAKVIEIKPAKF
jgi:diguanylate cyclase (GGDEF)-like protein